MMACLRRSRSRTKPLENQGSPQSTTIAREWSDNCQRLWTTLSAKSRPLNAYPSAQGIGAAGRRDVKAIAQSSRLVDEDQLAEATSIEALEDDRGSPHVKKYGRTFGSSLSTTATSNPSRLPE